MSKCKFFKSAAVKKYFFNGKIVIFYDTFNKTKLLLATLLTDKLSGEINSRLFHAQQASSVSMGADYSGLDYSAQGDQGH